MLQDWNIIDTIGAIFYFCVAEGGWTPRTLGSCTIRRWINFGQTLKYFVLVANCQFLPPVKRFWLSSARTSLSTRGKCILLILNSVSCTLSCSAFATNRQSESGNYQCSAKTISTSPIVATITVPNAVSSMIDRQLSVGDNPWIPEPNLSCCQLLPEKPHADDFFWLHHLIPEATFASPEEK